MKQSEIVAAVSAGRAVYTWVPLTIGRLELQVFADALKVDGIRVPVTAETSQQIADLLGACLTTPKIEDEIWQAAKRRCQPHLLPPTADWQRIQQRSQRLDMNLAGAGPNELVAGVGKSWCLSSKLTPSRAANYGLHAHNAPYASATLPGVKVWQPLGHVHNAQHTDWSQLLRLVRRRVRIDGAIEADLRDVLSAPALAPLVSHEGPLQHVRQPGVEELAASTIGGQPASVIVLPEMIIHAPRPKTQTPVSTAIGDVPGIPFRQARHFQRGPRSDVRYCVIHTAEVGETANAAEALQAYCATMPDGRRASWHFAVDSNSITQSVLERDVAYHAKQGNRYGVGVELAGRAAQQAAQWNDDYSRALLANAARLCAGIAKRWSIPIRKLSPEELLTGTERGFAGHVDFTRAYKVRGGHVDPGSNFPWADFLTAVLSHA